MILKAKERGNGLQLGQYLLRDTNEHVAVHELRGFVSGDLASALHEIDAISRGTRAKNFLFSMSFNPPQRERVPVADFESAIDAVEQKLGLLGQPRAVVFHEKDGRRHAHVVWSRIDADRMKAINLLHFKYKLGCLPAALYRARLANAARLGQQQRTRSPELQPGRMGTGQTRQSATSPRF